MTFGVTTRVAQIFLVGHKVTNVAMLRTLSQEIDPGHTGLISRDKWRQYCHNSENVFRSVHNNKLIF